MNPQKEPSQKLLLRLRQKTNMRFVIAGGCIVTLSAILLIYFNLTMVKEMKAHGKSNEVRVEKPVDMNVTQIKIDSTAANHAGANYKIAKPLQQDNRDN
jgi:hypothetical protein